MQAIVPGVRRGTPHWITDLQSKVSLPAAAGRASWQMRLVEAAVNAQYIWRRAARTSAGSNNQATNNPATGGTVNKHHLHLRHHHSKRHPRHLTRVPPRSNLGNLPPPTDAGAVSGRTRKQLLSRAGESPPADVTDVSCSLSVPPVLCTLPQQKEWRTALSFLSSFSFYYIKKTETAHRRAVGQLMAVYMCIVLPTRKVSGYAARRGKVFHDNYCNGSRPRHPASAVAADDNQHRDKRRSFC
ncbi:hypothetical protein HPB51_019361 [Rhipicephalus microplus]|uniref:Uncharacterized protein n=1 Tax=Rhipicephalus microplus TaxID=6941 RepID=A0A9J6DB54_RHIMP|nr:hypothetical protein HPB51_019361 [Rhipicephalus microplus]